MLLTSGSRLGVYEIVNLIGAGGMGEVYRARDLKLHREVGIKVLLGRRRGRQGRRGRRAKPHTVADDHDSGDDAGRRHSRHGGLHVAGAGARADEVTMPFASGSHRTARGSATSIFTCVASLTTMDTKAF